MTSFIPHPGLAGPLYGKNPWPLRFHTHGFDAACFNTLACSIRYNQHEFGTRKLGYDGMYYDGPSGEPPFESWRERWTGHHSISAPDGRTFPTTVEIHWTSMDGQKHGASLDLDKLFADRILLHTVARHEIKEDWLDSKSIDPVRPDILLEVNDHVVNIFMRALVATEVEQALGNTRCRLRDDLILAWTHTY